MDPRNYQITFINKVPQATTNRNYILHTEWLADEVNFFLTSSHETKYFAGLITHEDLKRNANELEIPYEKFFNDVKEALTRNGGLPSYQYSIEDNKFVLTNSEYFETRYLEVFIQQCYDLQRNFNMSAVDLIASLRGELATAKHESQTLKQKYETMVRTLDKYLEEKTSIEKKLMRKFTVLLNSKKDKIAELQDLLAEKTKKLREAKANGTEMGKRKSDEKIGDGDASVKKMQANSQLPIIKLPKRRKLNAEGKSANKTGSNHSSGQGTTPETKTKAKKDSKADHSREDKPPIKTYGKSTKTEDKPQLKTYSKAVRDIKSPTKTIPATKTSTETADKSSLSAEASESSNITETRDIAEHRGGGVVPLENLFENKTNVSRESPDIFADI